MNHKHPLDNAIAAAEGIKMLFGPGAYSQWTFAGSIRRQRDEVGDIDHVVMPALEVQPSADLFGTPCDPVNLIWLRLDDLVADPESGVAKATDARGLTCYGDVVRRVTYRGVRHEFYTATPLNIGVVLAIRTGPADLSRHLVTVIKQAGYECRNGFQVHRISNSALILDEDAARESEPVPVPDEEAFFRLAKVRFVPPQDRDALWSAIDRAESRAREAVLR
jgi:DNA polymerase/3'-5' exonuclease PolX